MFKKVHNINNPRKLIPAKKSLNGQTTKINTREMQFFFQKEKTAKISTIKVVNRVVTSGSYDFAVLHSNPCNSCRHATSAVENC